MGLEFAEDRGKNPKLALNYNLIPAIATAFATI